MDPTRRPLAERTTGADAAELLGLAVGLPLDAGRDLIERVGGLAALADHVPEELANRCGLTRRRALAVAAAFELGRRVAEARAEPGWSVRSPADVGERLAAAMAGLPREELRVLLLNTKNVVTAVITIYAGNLAGSSVRVGEVFRDAIRRQAAAIVVVHNHPSGDPNPSADDLRITAELAEAGRLLDIELLDHVVVGARGWVSLRAIGATGRQSSTTTRWTEPPRSAT
jgi:DNA repair protein RadC